MLKELEKLPAPEAEMMLKAPMLVCILIAGADNKIDRKEINGAIELSRKGKAKASLAGYYQLISEDFEDKLKITFQELPVDAQERNLLIVKQLSSLNAILPKINKTFSFDFYRSLTYIAKKIAESSGGVLGINKVGDEEMELVALPMIKDPSST
jgi:hypothetical protein